MNGGPWNFEGEPPLATPGEVTLEIKKDGNASARKEAAPGVFDLNLTLTPSAIAEFENTDQLAGYLIYSKLLSIRSPALLSAKDEPLQARDEVGVALGKIDLDALRIMRERGYDPRELLKWLARAGRANSATFRLFGGKSGVFPPLNLRVTQMTIWLRREEAKAELPVPRPLPRGLVPQALDAEKPDKAVAKFEAAKPAKAVKLTPAALARRLEESPAFRARPPAEKIGLLKDVMQDAPPSKSWERIAYYLGENIDMSVSWMFHNPFRTSEPPWVRRPFERLIEQIGRESPEGRREAFLYWHADAAPLTEKIAALDRISPRPRIATAAEYRARIKDNDALDPTQKFAALIDLIQGPNYEVFQEMREPLEGPSEFHSGIGPLVTQEVRRALIEAVYARGTMAERCGEDWPARLWGTVTRGYKSYHPLVVEKTNAPEGVRELDEEIWRYLRAPASPIPAAERIAITERIRGRIRNDLLDRTAKTTDYEKNLVKKVPGSTLHHFLPDDRELGITLDTLIEGFKLRPAYPADPVERVLSWKQVLYGLVNPRELVFPSAPPAGEAAVWDKNLVTSPQAAARIVAEVEAVIRQARAAGDEAGARRATDEAIALVHEMNPSNYWGWFAEGSIRKLKARAIERLRYRQVPETMAQMQALFDDLTDEEREGGLRSVLKAARKSKRPDELRDFFGLFDQYAKKKGKSNLPYDLANAYDALLPKLARIVTAESEPPKANDLAEPDPKPEPESVAEPESAQPLPRAITTRELFRRTMANPDFQALPPPDKIRWLLQAIQVEGGSPAPDVERYAGSRITFKGSLFSARSWIEKEILNQAVLGDASAKELAANWANDYYSNWKKRLATLDRIYPAEPVMPLQRLARLLDEARTASSLKEAYAIFQKINREPEYRQSIPVEPELRWRLLSAVFAHGTTAEKAGVGWHGVLGGTAQGNLAPRPLDRAILRYLQANAAGMQAGDLLAVVRQIHASWPVSRYWDVGYDERDLGITTEKAIEMLRGDAPLRGKTAGDRVDDWFGQWGSVTTLARLFGPFNPDGSPSPEASHYLDSHLRIWPRANSLLKLILTEAEREIRSAPEAEREKAIDAALHHIDAIEKNKVDLLTRWILDRARQRIRYREIPGTVAEAVALFPALTPEEKRLAARNALGAAVGEEQLTEAFGLLGKLRMDDALKLALERRLPELVDHAIARGDREPALSDADRGFLLGDGWRQTVDARLAFKMLKKILQESRRLAPADRVAILKPYDDTERRKLELDWDGIILERFREVNAREPIETRMGKLLEALSDPQALARELGVLAPKGSPEAVEGIVSPDAIRGAILTEISRAALLDTRAEPEEKRARIRDRAIERIRDAQIAILIDPKAYSGITAADCERVIEGLRYRDLPKTVAEAQSRYAELTREEKMKMLTGLLREAATPGELEALLDLIRGWSNETSPLRAGDPDFERLYRARIADFHDAAYINGDRGFLLGTNWPRGLPTPADTSPVKEILKLYQRLAADPTLSPYERFTIVSQLADPRSAVKYGWRDLLEAVVGSPHFKALPPTDQVEVLDHFARFADGPWKWAYHFLKEHRAANQPMPEGLLAAVRKGDHPSIKIPVDMGGIQNRHTPILEALVELRRGEGSQADPAADEKAAKLASVLGGEQAFFFASRESVTRQRLAAAARIRPRQIPRTLAELKAHDATRAPLVLAETDAAFQNALRDASTPDELLEVLERLRGHGDGVGDVSEALKALVRKRFPDLISAALDRGQFDVLDLAKGRWPDWMVGDEELRALREKAVKNALLDPRLPAEESARRAVEFAYVDLSEKYWDAIRAKMTPEALFALEADTEYRKRYYEREFGLKAPENNSVELRKLREHFLDLLFSAKNGPWSRDAVLEAAARERFWEKARGKGMREFIHQSKGAALRQQLERDAQQAERDVARSGELIADHGKWAADQEDLAARKEFEAKSAAHELERARLEDPNAAAAFDRYRRKTVIFGTGDYDLAVTPNGTRLLTLHRRVETAKEDAERARKRAEDHRDGVKYWEREQARHAKRLAVLRPQLARVSDEIAALEAIAKDAEGVSTGFRGPAYEYHLESSEKIQRFLVERLRASGNYPADPLGEFKLLAALARRGATAFTDAELHRLLTDPGFECVACLREALEGRLLWDFEYRREVYDRWRSADAAYAARVQAIRASTDADERAKGILEEIAAIHAVFPEESVPRGQALEGFSAEIGSLPAEARLIQKAKYDEGTELESSAFRLFRHLAEKLPEPGQKLALIRYLQGKGPLPGAIAEVVRGGMGEARLLRQFQSLAPEMRMVILDPIVNQFVGGLAGPKEARVKKELVDMVVRDAGEHEADARLLVEALLDSLSRASPHEESLALSFLLGQVGRVGGSPGQKLRVLLDSMGGTGTALGQHFVQRRSLPPEYLTHLEDLQDNARRPDRVPLYEQMAEALKSEDVDRILGFESIEGAASARVVLKVRMKERGGEVAAMKLLRRNLRRSTELEIRKLGYMLAYLEEHGPPSYRRLRGPIEAVQRALKAQADLSLEAKAYPRMVELYSGHYQKSDAAPVSVSRTPAAGTVPATAPNADTIRRGFAIHVVRPDDKATTESEHAFEEFATGEGLKSLASRAEKGHFPKERFADVFAAIFDAERDILLAPPDPRDGLVHFEADRHMGNFKVDFERSPPTIFIFDYPLISQIESGRRDSVFRMLGLLEYVRQSGLPIIPEALARAITDELVTGAAALGQSAPVAGLGPEADPRARRARLQSAIRESLAKAMRGDRANLSAPQLLLDVLATGDGAGFPVHDSVYSYLKALGYLERYAPSPEEFHDLLKTRITGLLAGFGSDFSFGDKCGMAWHGVLRALSGR